MFILSLHLGLHTPWGCLNPRFKNIELEWLNHCDFLLSNSLKLNLFAGVESLGYFLVLVTGCKRVGLVLESDIYRITDVSFASIKNGVIESSSAASEVI